MSAINNESKETVTTPESQGVPSATAARRRRRIVVNMLRVLLLVVIIGGWDLGADRDVGDAGDGAGSLVGANRRHVRRDCPRLSDRRGARGHLWCGPGT